MTILAWSAGNISEVAWRFCQLLVSENWTDILWVDRAVVVTSLFKVDVDPGQGQGLSQGFGQGCHHQNLSWVPRACL